MRSTSGQRRFGRAAFRLTVLGALTAILVVLVAPQVVPRLGTSTPTSRVQSALHVAELKWGEVCGGQAVVVTRGDLGLRRRLAEARYEFPTGSEDDASTYFNCRITFRMGHISGPVFCTGMVHEVGHLAGFRERPGYRVTLPDGRDVSDPDHSADPNSIMYPSQEFVWRGCSGARPRSARGTRITIDRPRP